MSITERQLQGALDFAIDRLGPRLVVGTPLGLGKANHLLNALYRRAQADPDLHVEIFTALSLDIPQGESELERRFIEPFVARFYGADYPRLEYLVDLKRGRLPPNVKVVEFYFQSGSRLSDPVSQQNYISSNYTHVARDMADRGVNLILQAVAAGEVAGEPALSLSCNPDVTLDLARRLADQNQACVFLAEIHPDLPFMHGDAIVREDFFDRVVELEQPGQLFAVPRAQVSRTDHLIGLHASTLIADGGTLQIGIGSLSDALVHALIMRQQDNPAYQDLVHGIGLHPVSESLGSLEPFVEGLYGASEMFMDGFMHLYRAGILRRGCYEDPAIQGLANDGLLPETPSADLLRALIAGQIVEAVLDPADLLWLQRFGIVHPEVRLLNGELVLPGGTRVPNDLNDAQAFAHLVRHGLGSAITPGVLLHGAFFLGSRAFYDWLRQLPEGERQRFHMSAVSRVNQLYGGNEDLEILQRRRARFVNTCMKMTLTGAAVSDQLEDHQVVSGVGGQYNFVAMAHALDQGRSILMLRSTRGGESNLVWKYPHTTIPGHLRDLVVTEYGVAQLRGKSDSECIAALLEICDRRHQRALMRTAKRHGKLPRSHRISDHARSNTPERLAQMTRGASLPAWPFGSDFTELELELIQALQKLKKTRGWQWPALLARAYRSEPSAHVPAMQRMGLAEPGGWRERLYARLLSAALDGG